MQVMWRNMEHLINHDRRSNAEDDVATRGASDRAIKSRSSLKDGGGGTWCIITRRRIIFKMI